MGLGALARAYPDAAARGDRATLARAVELAHAVLALEAIRLAEDVLKRDATWATNAARLATTALGLPYSPAGRVRPERF